MKTHTRSLIASAALVGTVALMSGCSNESPLAPSAPASTGPAEISTVGMTLQDLSNPFFATMKASLEALGQENGLTVNIQDGQQDLGRQNDQIDTFIQQKVDLILLNAVNTDGIGSAVQRALDAGIIVVAVDVDAANAQAVVSTDNVEAGRIACQALADKIGGSGNVMIIDGVQVSAVQERVQGCHEVLEADYPDIAVVAEQSNKSNVASGQEVATDMLTANQDVQGIFGNNDPTARGVVLAIEQANRSGIWVTGVDGSPEAVTEMERSGSAFWATASQDPGYMVTKGFEIAEAIAAGNPPAERVTLVTPEIVTQETVGDYAGWVTD
ncbi:MAG: substrate-binding domain-containing protein [Propioniciclava sp.]